MTHSNGGTTDQLIQEILDQEITVEMAAAGLEALGEAKPNQIKSGLVASIYSHMEAARRLSPEETQLDCLVFGK